MYNNKFWGDYNCTRWIPLCSSLYLPSGRASFCSVTVTVLALFLPSLSVSRLPHSLPSASIFRSFASYHSCRHRRSSPSPSPTLVSGFSINMRFLSLLTGFGIIALAAGQNATNTTNTTHSATSVSSSASSTASLNAQVICLQKCEHASVISEYQTS